MNLIAFRFTIFFQFARIAFVLAAIYSYVTPLQAQIKSQDQARAFEQLEKSITTRLDKAEKDRAQERIDDREKLEKDIALKKELLEIRKDVTANAQKSVDWWLVIVGLFFAGVGIAAPLLVIRQQNIQHQKALSDVLQIKKDIEAERQSVALSVKAISDDAQKVRAHAKEIADSKATLENAPVGNSNERSTSKNEMDALIKAAQTIEASTEATLSDKLFAKGIEAVSQNNWLDAQTWFSACSTSDPSNSSALSNWGAALGQLADIADGTERQRLQMEAITKYEAAIKIKPDKHEALNNWGLTLDHLAGAAVGTERNRLRMEAITKYDAALKIKPDKHEALNNWGLTLDHLADATVGTERHRFRMEAIAKYEAALKIKPDKYDALISWGVALGRLADSADGTERLKLRMEAISKYEAALKIKPDKYEALSNWGVALGRLANSADGTERQRLRMEAISKYEAALKITPDRHEALINWGAVLGQIADAVEGIDRQQLRMEEITKYAAALNIKPDLHEALSNWAGTLMKMATESIDPAEREKLLSDAESKLAKCQAITGHHSYNQACLAAIRKQANQFIQIADALPKDKFPNEALMRDDPDLDSIRQTPEFKAWWRNRFGNES
jgi:tetratricopeptide (TPR) repeat protein